MEFFAPPLVASLLGSGTAAASSNGEACRRASSRPAELLKCIPLCILQYPPFFLPLSKQQASRHLGYFKFVPPRSTPLPLPSRYMRARTHTHARRDDFKRKWIHVLFCFFPPASFTKVNTLIFVCVCACLFLLL